MTEDEKKKLEEQLSYLYNESKSEGGELQNPEGLIANSSTFGLEEGSNEMDYKEEMKTSYYESKEVLENMAAMYLDDKQELIQNNYIKNKVLNDAQNLSDMSFLQKIAKRAIVKQMEQIEMGEATPRHYETLAIMMREIRENIKQSTVTVSTMEGFYKQLRVDMGLNQQISAGELSNEPQKTDIITANDVHSRLDEIIKNRSNNNNIKE